jgi:hypothetical protein
MAAPTTLTLPHPILTPIITTPTNSSIQVLQKQLYANARAVPSTRGGGVNGHLALVMAAPAYLARATVAFVAPVHPGNAPVHAVDATQVRITETNRQFLATMAEVKVYLQVKEELKKLILQAVPNLYLQILEDEDFGFADISPLAMLTHLKTTYGTITREEIDRNRERLHETWAPDTPIEDLWAKLAEIQRMALAAQEAIPDSAVIRATLTTFEKTGVFTTACEKWRDKPDIDWTVLNIKQHFERANKERIRQLTAKQAGYHGANIADATEASTNDNSDNSRPPPTIITPGANNSTVASANSATSGITTNNVQMYYCWTHGLGMNPEHTSASCQNKADGHKNLATANNLLGGNDRIMASRGPRRRLPE